MPRQAAVGRPALGRRWRRPSWHLVAWWLRSPRRRRQREGRGRSAAGGSPHSLKRRAGVPSRLWSNCSQAEQACEQLLTPEQLLVGCEQLLSHPALLLYPLHPGTKLTAIGLCLVPSQALIADCLTRWCIWYAVECVMCELSLRCVAACVCQGLWRCVLETYVA